MATKQSDASKPNVRITPLAIVAAFVTLTEAALALALPRVAGGVQIALTCFVIGFPIVIAGAFFVILWSRPYVFYAPSEYGGQVNPTDFMAAIRRAPMVAGQIQLAKSLEENPLDTEARFALIDSMADEVECQFVILMHEFDRDVPNYTRYVYRHGSGGGSGTFGVSKNRLEGTGLVRVGGSGRFRTLTDEGHEFAKWLLQKGRKCDFFWTSIGSWGSLPVDATSEQKWLEDAMRAESAKTTITR